MKPDFVHDTKHKLTLCYQLDQQKFIKDNVMV